MDTDEDRISFGASVKRFFRDHWQGLLSFMVPLVFLPIYFIKVEGGKGKEFQCLYVICIMAVYWITECIPLYMTSMIPMAVLPLMGILDSGQVTMQYFSNTLVLFLGGLIVALAIEYSNLHIRVALGVIRIVGCSPRRLHFGLLLVTASVSLWISNSAATAMMCPIIKAVLTELHGQNLVNMYAEEDAESKEEENRSPSKIAEAYYLGLAYAATMGGCGTLIGTGTNLTMKGIYDNRFPDATEAMDFPIFMAYACPVAMIDVLLLYIFLQFYFMGLCRPNSREGKEIARGKEGAHLAEEVIDKKYAELGPVTCHEIQVLIVFVLMVVLLFVRSPGFMIGWGDFFNAKSMGGSAAVLLCVLLLFVLPKNYSCVKFCCGAGPYTTNETGSLLSWQYANAHSPWGLVFLLGGGYALAEASTTSGMASMMGNALAKLTGGMASPLLQFISIIFTLIMTTFSSNVAIANILLPIYIEMAVSSRIHPLYMVFPAGLACSMAFHLPVSTPPNAIAASYANIKTLHMIVAGIGPTLIALVTLFINAQTWGYVVYPGTLEFPSWAENPNPKS